MKKKLLTIVMALAMSLQASACLAAEDDAWKSNTGTINLDTLAISGEGISVSENVVTITKGGDFEVTGTLKDGMIYVNSEEKVKLRLSGMSLTNTTGPAIFFDNTEKGLITITENTENYLEDGKEYITEDADAPLFSNDDLEIKGSGTLTVTGNYQHGIAGDDDVSIENGNIIINSYEHGIKVNDTLSVLGGKLSITSETGKGMKAELEVIIDGGDINVTSLQSEGIESKGTLTINGGNINITAHDDGMNTGNADTTEASASPAVENAETGQFPGRGNREMQGEMPQMPEGEMTPPEGMTPPENMTPPEGMTPPENMTPPEGITPPDGMTPPEGGFGGGRGGMGGFGAIDEETAAAHALTINGGDIYINANGDGIDSNGNLSITGGNLVVDGPLNTGNGPLDCDGTMSITGGTVILSSSFGMMQLPRNTDGQNILSVVFSQKQSADTEVVIKETQSGEEIISHTPTKEFQSFILSSDKITEGTEYTVYINGEEYEAATATSGITNVGTTAHDGFGGGRGNRGEMGRNHQNSRIRVSVDGKDIRFDTDPVIKNDTTLVGFRAILEALGATVEWDENTKKVTAEKDGTTIVLQIGSKSAKVNGEEKTLLLAPEIINDSTMIPIRFVSEELNMNVNWDGNTKHITVTSK